MTRRKRKWDEILEDDPTAGLLNLFDVWMVFAISLLLAMVTYYNMPELVTSHSEVTIVKDPGGKDMQIIKKKGVKIERYRVTPNRMGGEGEKLGTAYRLKTGEVVYVPEEASPK